ncbi:PINIT domain-containing protein [Mycena floridula]|nr:PINIT domain-containing protein [Mycena floridula]
MASSAWEDFENLRHTVKNNTVDRLKQIVLGLNDECGARIQKTGKKQDIIDRIVVALETWRRNNQEDVWLKAKVILYQVRNSGIYTPSPQSRPHPNPMHAAVPLSYPVPGIVKQASTSFTGVAGTGIRPYDPYASSRKASTSVNGAGSSSNLAKPAQPKTGLRFKESPFFQVDQSVSPIVECPESTSATDRRQQSVSFTLTPEQSNKMRDGRYQLRLFCTSSTFYSANPNFRPNTAPCLVEFPPTCEVRVNSVQLTANLKGLKKKPGTAPPPDLGKYIRTGSQNRIEMVYVNSQQPVPSKKFYLVVMLVESTSVARLVNGLKETNFKTYAEIQQKMRDSILDDDDIVAGPQKMSLKCPLSFMRVGTPCRSSKCVHPQCFDATSWYSVMEQTTTWLCPVCEQVLDSKDLIIDGYFSEILNQTSDDVDDVVVEADGEWHTADNKFGSAAWKAKHPPATKATPPSPRKPAAPPVATASRVGDALLSDKPENPVVFVLDSDDEDEGRVKRELSPSFGSGSSASANRSFNQIPPPESAPPTQPDEIIDLTLSDSDDDEPPPMSKQAGKRKADDAGLNPVASPTEIWKRSRVDSDQSRTLPSLGGHDYPPFHQASARTLAIPERSPVVQPARYNQPYSGQLPPFNDFAAGRNPVPVNLPPILDYPHLNGAGTSGSRWSS